MKVLRATVIFGVSLSLQMLSPDFGAADEIETLYIRANEHYQNNDFNAAVAEYQKIVDLGYESWEVYYNLGNAHYKNGEIAQSILHYERAKKLEPQNEDVNFNLELANLSVVDRIPQLPRFLPYAWMSALATHIGLKTLGIFSAVFYILFVAIVIAQRFSARSGLTKFASVISGVGLVVFCGLFLLRVYETESITEAIVVESRVDVMSAPAGAGTELFTLHEGVKVHVQDRSETWVKIRLSDGKVGWLMNESVEKI
jgi:tetratricopeptide (TPR) repeat protein